MGCAASNITHPVKCFFGKKLGDERTKFRKNIVTKSVVKSGCAKLAAISFEKEADL